MGNGRTSTIIIMKDSGCWYKTAKNERHWAKSDLKGSTVAVNLASYITSTPPSSPAHNHQRALPSPNYAHIGRPTATQPIAPVSIAGEDTPGQ